MRERRHFKFLKITSITNQINEANHHFSPVSINFFNVLPKCDKADLL